jgi:Actinobacteria/chloroflexi VLRF1 release factor
VAGGGRWVEVDPERLPRWLDGFRQRHGAYHAEPAGGGVLVVTAADGAVARLHPPPGATGGGDLAGFVADARAPRRLGLLLARKSAAAVGVADGAQLAVSKVDSWYVQSRTAAGGQSQQRFARRRVNQATAAAGKAADIVARLLLPAAGLAALVTGGDRSTVEAILADPRLAPLRPLRSERHLPVPTPNLAVLRGAIGAARSVGIHLLPPVDHEARDVD